MSNGEPGFTPPVAELARKWLQEGVFPDGVIEPYEPPSGEAIWMTTTLFGKPYAWTVDIGGKYRLRRVPTPPMYDELVRAYVALADANRSFRGVRPRG